MSTRNDTYWMTQALALARKGVGKTSPNPCVGAVLVKHGRRVGSGYHARAGRDHAEVSAIKKAGSAAKGATLYVTLEPCSSFGKTPPCTGAVISSGVKRVVMAAFDPNASNAKKAVRLLSKHKILIKTGVLKQEAEDLNRPFTTWIQKKRPFTTLKLAQSLDGKIATPSGESRWISSKPSRRIVQELRCRVDAVLVGIGTVLHDDPRLQVRLLKKNRRQSKKEVLKIIVDSKLRIQPRARVFQTPGRVLLVTTPQSSLAKRKKMAKMADVLVVKARQGAVDLKALWNELGRRQLMHLLVEGGGEMAASLIRERLVDEAYFFIAPKIIGGRSATTSVEGRGIRHLKDAVLLNNMEVKKIGSDYLFYGRFSDKR